MRLAGSSMLPVFVDMMTNDVGRLLEMLGGILDNLVFYQLLPKIFGVFLISLFVILLSMALQLQVHVLACTWVQVVMMEFALFPHLLAHHHHHPLLAQIFPKVSKSSAPKVSSDLQLARVYTCES